jgi:hypothetical protein
MAENWPVFQHQNQNLYISRYFFLPMITKMFNPIKPTFRTSANPTLTEIYRIRQTMEVLKENEKAIVEKLNRLLPESDVSQNEDVHQQVLFMYQSWNELRGRVDLLPDAFIDKYFWLTDIKDGLERCAEYVKKTQ